MRDVTAVTRLITYTDVHDWVGQPPDQLSFSAVLMAQLVDGRQIVLLEGRGWSEGARFAGGGAPPDQWSSVTREAIEETAVVVVGPDEPAPGQSQEEAARTHWSYLAGVLDAQGVAASADDLRSLPHVVVLSDRLLARVADRPLT